MLYSTARYLKGHLRRRPRLALVDNFFDLCQHLFFRLGERRARHWR
jgi:hypothetical protein